ncbi:MAG TPA: citrate/2-methylcitrate synthase [Phycisphaerae bacterium]|nr:citrate/2-methylcitrate synthase [Phycisphaerae bacterium]
MTAAAVEEKYHPGLEGVIAGETSVSTVEQSSLAYRGYPIDQLAERATFEETAYLLLHDALPTRAELQRFRARIDEHRTLPAPVLDAIRVMPPETPGMDVLRTAVSMAAHWNNRSGADLASGTGADLWREQSTAILAIVPTIIAARMRFLAGHEPIPPSPGLSHAAQFYHMAFDSRPPTLHERILDLTLTLYAEHEFNASTFAVRVCASTTSDISSAVVAGIGTLKGPLHGGANEEVVRHIFEPLRNGEQARKWTEDALARKQLIMGFGHRVYKHGDHRAKILEPYVEQMAAERNDPGRLEVYRTVRDIVLEKKGLYPNTDYPCGLVYFLMGLPVDVYTPLFVASRVTGWCAHFIEQRLHNRIIRPRSRYIGPAIRNVVPLDQRG